MDVSEWERFVSSGQRADRFVGRLSAYLNGFLMASSREVRIGHDYVLKAINKHGLSIEHLPLIAEALRQGEVIHDRPRHLTFFYLSESHQRWFQVTIKCCTEKRHLFVTTFHGMSASDIARKRKNFQPVWPHP